MKLYEVTFDDSDAVVVESGIAVSDDNGLVAANLGTDVGGATLAMIDLLIPVLEQSRATFSGEGDRRRLLAATVEYDEDGRISFLGGSDREPETAFVVLSVIQRSPDARTELANYGEGVECIGNAFERPMDKQLLVMNAGSRVLFRRFGRGGNYGPWQTVAWDGAELRTSTAQENAG
jgi:hypothetical protein